MPNFPDDNDPGAGSPDMASPPDLTNPDIDPKTLEGRLPAIADESQVSAIHDNFLNINRPRIAQLAQITAKYDGITGPYDNSKLQEVGSAWYSNFSTRALGSKADIVAPRLKMRVKQAPSVTASALPSTYEGADGFNKTKAFQQAITQTFRAWPKNDTFTGGVSHEASLYGRCIVAFIDQWSPWPRIYRTDKAFVPEGTEVGEWDVGVCSIQEFFRQDQLFDQVRDREAAQAAGWDVEACVKAINNANTVPATTSTDVYMARTHQDLFRESTPGYSYLKGINVIEVIINFSTEYDGSVTQWIVTKQGGIKLFRANYPDMVMADFVMPWTFQFGNGKFYGSYGVGHILYDLCVQMEKARNKVFDNYWNRNRIFVQVEAGQMQKANMTILDDVTYIEGGVIAGNAAAYPSVTQDFERLNQIFGLMADDMIASYSPQPVDPKSRPIAAQANINEVMQDERAIPTTDLFLTQWSRLIWMVQRRLCRKGNPVKEAAACRETLLKTLSEEEIEAIIKNPPYDTVMGEQRSENEKKAAFLTKIVETNDPHYNQVNVRKQLDVIYLGPGGDEGLLLNEVDNTDQIVQTRQQQMETYSMSEGHQIPVAPNDGHAIHMAFLKGQPSPNGLTGPLPMALTTANQVLQTNPPDLQAAGKLASLAAIYYQHYIQHFDFLAQAPGKKPWENSEKQFIAQIGKLLNQINVHIQKAQQEQLQQQQQASGKPGQPPLAAPPPSIPKPGVTPMPGQPSTVLPGHPVPTPPQPQPLAA